MSGYKALWTNRAIKSAGDIVEYLREKWTDKEVNNFLDKIDEILPLSKSILNYFALPLKSQMFI